MLSYATRRLMGAIPTLFVIVTVAFFMMRIAPGGPFDSQRRLPPEIEHNIEAAYNLDKPLYTQYFIYLDRLAHFDLGPSYKIKDFTVTQLIAQGLPVSVRLGASAIVIALIFGISLGTFAALYQNKTSRPCRDERGDGRHHHPHIRHRTDSHARYSASMASICSATTFRCRSAAGTTARSKT